MAVKLTGRDAARIKSDFDPPTAAPRTAAQTGRGRPKKRQEETKTVCFRLHENTSKNNDSVCDIKKMFSADIPAHNRHAYIITLKFQIQENKRQGKKP